MPPLHLGSEQSPRRSQAVQVKTRELRGAGDVVVKHVSTDANPADLYTKHLESKAKIEQLVALFGGEFRGGRAAAAPQLRQDPAVAGMVEVLVGESTAASGEMYEWHVLPHLLPAQEMDRLFEVAHLDDSNGQDRLSRSRLPRSSLTQDLVVASTTTRRSHRRELSSSRPRRRAT